MTTTDILGSAVLDDGSQIMLFGNGLTDGTEGNVAVRDIGGDNTKQIGEACAGRRLRKLKLMASIGSILEDVIVYGTDGAKIVNIASYVELSGIWENYNIILENLDIPLSKGVRIAALTAD